MRKWINKHPYLVASFLVCAVLSMVAARPRGVSRTNTLWVAADTDTPGNVTCDSYNGTHNAYVNGAMEVDGIIYADGGITDVTGGVTAGEIADVTRDIFFDLAAGTQDGGQDVDDGSTPTLGTVDEVPALVWDDSSETNAVQWTFPVPSDYSTGMTFYAMISSSAASGSLASLDWALVNNTDATAFGSAVGQTAVTSTESALNTKNDILTLTPDATGAAYFSSGNVVTLEVFNASTSASTLELKALWGEYTATQ